MTDSTPPHSPPSSDNTPQTPVDLTQPKAHAALQRYWRANVRIMLLLLAVWAFVGLGCGVLWADWLNALVIHGQPVRLGGFPLGFWFAQQGSIIVFVLLILIYAVLLNKLDRRHHEELQQLRNTNRN